MTDLAGGHGVRGRSAMRGDWRLILMIGVFCMCYAAAGFRMALLAATEPEEPRLARSDSAIRPVRGTIVDRNGNLLAANLPAWSLYAHPREITDPFAVADALVGIFPDIDREELLKKLTGKNRFAWIKRPIAPREKQAVHDLGFPGLNFGNREIRIYPTRRTTAHIVGGVKAAREDVRFAELTGSGGIEQHFDERLRDPSKVDEPLRLSLDLTLQQAVREVLAAGMEEMTAKGASAILMKVTNGEVLAMVSLPDFEPNGRPERHRGDPSTNPRFNRAAQGRYELGSTFKVLTAAMALDAGVANASTMIETPPRLRYGRQSIGDSHKMKPEMSLEDVIVKSSNVGSARLALMVGTPRFKEYLKRLGMFEPSGLELSEAAKAKPLLPPRWTDLSTITIAFGHGLAASPVHLAGAYATIANDGVRVRPSLIHGGNPPGERVFSRTAAREMVRIMREVVKRGTARKADVEGYMVGGKTGTAEKAGPGGYDRRRVISTFASVFPTSRPEYVLVVSLDEPTYETDYGAKVRTAGWTAVPVAANIIRRVAPLMGLRPLPPVAEPAVAALNVNME